MKISLANPSNAEKSVYGQVKLSLYGTKNQLIEAQITSRSDKFIHGENALYLYIDKMDVGRIQRVEFYWNYDGLVIDPGSVCGLLCNDALYVSSVEISELMNYPENTIKSCPLGASYVEIKDKKTADFYPTACWN